MSTLTPTPYIPGAPASSKVKTKRSKKKASNRSVSDNASTNGAGTGAGSEVAVNPDVIPGAAVAQAQAQAQESVTAVPSSLTEDAIAIAGDGTGISSKEKGPVEEVIAKRMRQLSKKIQRFRGYQSQPHDKLNADQKSGIASLPQLEGVYRELEDLSKQVESVELEQAGKVREIKEQAKQEAESVATSRVAESQFALSTSLGLFLRLHALLHPARSGDHEHLTFARLDLPAILQDEVQATDVLRVGRMHEDLVAGGQRGADVLAGLLKGPTDEDEENDHVHHLLKLLGSADSYPADASAPEEEEVSEEGAPEIEEPISTAVSDHGLPNGHTAEEGPAPIAPAGASTGALNFLQEDELADEDSYEVKPHLEPHQTSGSQPPAENLDLASQPVAEPTTTQSNVPSPAATAPPNTIRQYDWAADEDLDEETEAAQIREAFAMAASGAATPAIPSTEGKVAEAVQHTEEGDVTAIVQENELANAHVIQGADGVAAPTAVDSVVPAPLPVKHANVGGEEQDIQKRQQGRQGRGRGRQQSGRPHNSGQSKLEGSAGVPKQGQGRGLPRVPSKTTPSVDDDGFQVVGRQASFSGGSGNNSQRGRGSGRARGDGVGRGRGGQSQGQGSGRGEAASRVGRRAPSGVNASVQAPEFPGQNFENAGARPPRHNRQPSQTQSKAPPAPAPVASA
ncbi:hypothetical protein I316_06029 [Kwoniella heveanensis BCC8398]|uniref:Uncharacterized protein n=1 Tax=Kwoniella heveanensis BCC8398 TaxID=1296120 RepID=A0A1B9GMS5_9TREE|nr:hypothetical protein I316_06029 [Kwoniella heveanensis BCC8398]